VANIGHAEPDSGAANGEFAHGCQFLGSGSERGLDRGDLAEPALFLGFLQPEDEVSVDPLQPRHLSRINPKKWAPDASVFMRTRRSMIASACSESDLPQLEVGEERIPFLGGEITVLLAGPLGPATRDERPVMRDDVLRVDRRVALYRARICRTGQYFLVRTPGRTPDRQGKK
jgi:hypothetical protein